MGTNYIKVEKRRSYEHLSWYKSELSLARQSRVPATALGFAAVRIEKKMKGSQGMPGKVSVVEGSYWNDSMHDKDFSSSGGTE